MSDGSSGTSTTPNVSLDQAEGVFDYNVTSSNPVDLGAGGSLTVTPAGAVMPVLFTHRLAATVPSASRPDGVDVGESVVFSENAVGGSAPLTYHWSFVQGATCSPILRSELPCRFLVPEYASVTVPDSTGTNSSSPTQWYRALADPAIGGSIAHRASLDQGQSLNLSIPVVLPGLPPDTYLGSGLPTNCSASDSSRVACVPAAPGNYLVCARLLDGNGVQTGASTLALRVSSDPLAGRIEFDPANVSAGQSFSVSVSVQGGTGTYTSNWTGIPPERTPSGPLSLRCETVPGGTYRVEVRVSDSNGEVSYAGPAQLFVGGANGEHHETPANSLLAIDALAALAVGSVVGAILVGLFRRARRSTR